MRGKAELQVWNPELVRDTIERLETLYGRPTYAPRFDPIEELVCCILSQHTTDAVSFPAFDRLHALLPTWEAVVEAGPDRVAEVVRNVGLANQKAGRIIESLKKIHAEFGSFSLEELRDLPMLEARDWLMTLPGVGPKTASIVLCFSFGMPLIPVDTHVFRVGWRLGLFSKAIGEAKAHDVLLGLVPSEAAFRFHVALIEHGRKVCRAPKPRCGDCPLTDRCACFLSGNCGAAG